MVAVAGIAAMTKLLMLSAALAAVCGTADAQSRPAVRSGTQADPGSATLAKGDRQERYELAHKLVSEWGPYVKAIYGEDVGPWAKRLTPTLQRASTRQLRDAALADSFPAMMNGLTGGKAPDAADLPGGITPKALGDVAADLVFTPLPQCNLLDTRVVGGTFSAGVFKHFKASGSSFASQGGSNTNCGIPANVRALQLGVTAVNPTAKGYFKLWPYGETQPAASSMSFGPSQNTRNDIVLRVSQGLAYDFTAASNVGGGHLLVTVVGYYAPPEASALDCRYPDGFETGQLLAPGFDGGVVAPACPAGYNATMPYCWTAADGVVLKGVGPIANIPGQAIFCHFKNSSANSAMAYASTQCCRVPGR